MSLRPIENQFEKKSFVSFNMTAIIDIVFLLIIFFMVVSQFIDAENFPVAVPDNCDFAQADNPRNTQVTTVTVIKDAGDKIAYAVDSEQIHADDDEHLVTELARLIDDRLGNLTPENRAVTLRIDKDIRFERAQYALAAIAASSATDIKLAAIKIKRPQ